MTVPDVHRLRALIVLLWRAGLRIRALALQESDLDGGRGAVLVRRGKGGKRREVGMDRWAWEQLDSWLEIRRELPIGALLCVIHVLDEPTGAAMLVIELGTREYLDAWIAWATGSGGPPPTMRHYVPPRPTMPTKRI